MDLDAPPVRTQVGRQLTASLSGCAPERLEEIERVERALREASEAVGAKVLRVLTHRFSPQGMTSVAILSESHAVIHTWPEHGALTFDLFTCAGPEELDVALGPLELAFAPAERSVEVAPRNVTAGRPASLAVERRP